MAYAKAERSRSCSGESAEWKSWQTGDDAKCIGCSDDDKGIVVYLEALYPCIGQLVEGAAPCGPPAHRYRARGCWKGNHAKNTNWWCKRCSAGYTDEKKKEDAIAWCCDWCKKWHKAGCPENIAEFARQFGIDPCHTYPSLALQFLVPQPDKPRIVQMEQKKESPWAKDCMSSKEIPSRTSSKESAGKGSNKGKQSEDDPFKGFLEEARSQTSSKEEIAGEDSQGEYVEEEWPSFEAVGHAEINVDVDIEVEAPAESQQEIDELKKTVENLHKRQEELEKTVETLKMGLEAMARCQGLTGKEKNAAPELS